MVSFDLPEPLSISATAAVILLGDGHLASSRALSSLGGDISGNGISKLFLTIAAAFAEAERDRIRERSGQGKADQRARGRISAGRYRLGDEGELVPHEAEQGAIREMVAMKAQGYP